jgi:hypothetical protein
MTKAESAKRNHLRANKGRIAITTSKPHMIQMAADSTSGDSMIIVDYGEELTPCQRKLLPPRRKRALRRGSRDRDFRELTSKVILLTSKVTLLTSKVVLLTSKVILLTSKATRKVSKTSLLTSKTPFLSRIGRFPGRISFLLTSDIRCLTSDSTAALFE